MGAFYLPAQTLSCEYWQNAVLSLIFFKYISDAFNGRYDQLKLELEGPKSNWFVAEDNSPIRYVE